MFTQIYSIQTVEEALGCVEAGADRIGVLVGTPGGKFPCAIHEDEADRIFKALKGKAVRVLISVADNERDILDQTKHLCGGQRERYSGPDETASSGCAPPVRKLYRKPGVP